jgi:hypothetical protein
MGGPGRRSPEGLAGTPPMAGSPGWGAEFSCADLLVVWAHERWSRELAAPPRDWRHLAQGLAGRSWFDVWGLGLGNV